VSQTRDEHENGGPSKLQDMQLQDIELAQKRQTFEAAEYIE